MTDLPPPVSELAAYYRMIEKVIQTVAGKKGRAGLKSVDRDDMYQSLFVALIRTTETYDPAGGACWSGYAFTSLLLRARTLMSCARRRCGRHRGQVKHVPMSGVSRSLLRGTHLCYARNDDRLADIDGRDESGFVISTVGRLLAAVNPSRDRRVVAAYYGIGCPCKDTVELAAELSVLKQRVQQILGRALVKMRSAARPAGPPGGAG